MKVCACGWSSEFLAPRFRRLHIQCLKGVLLTYSPFGKRLYVNPWVLATVENAPVLLFPGLHIRLEYDVRWDTDSDVYIRGCMVVKYIYGTPRPYASLYDYYDTAVTCSEGVRW